MTVNTLNTRIIQDFSEQYQAALKMTEDVIVNCKDELWQDHTHQEVISQVVYHILASADYCLCKTNEERISFQRKFGDSGFNFHDQNKDFTKKQLKEYFDEIKNKADKLFATLTVEAFFNEPIYDLQGTLSLYNSLLNNLRHIMNHVGAIHARLTILGNENIPYVSQVYGDERDSLNDLNNQGVNDILSGKLDEAEKIYLELTTKSENPLYHYNLACVDSRKERRDQALTELKKCLESSNSFQNKFYRNLAKTDSDFTNIKDLPEFQQLIS